MDPKLAAMNNVCYDIYSSISMNMNKDCSQQNPYILTKDLINIIVHEQ